MATTITRIHTSKYILTSSGNPLSITGTGGVETSSGTAIYGGLTQAWTITNAGTVSGGSAPGSLGIDLRAGGKIDNTGRISGSHYGVRIQGAAGTVTNAGSITSAIDGVVLFAGGSVSNAAGGVIVGTLNAGVYISGGAGTVTNAGTIIGAAVGAAVQFVGAFADRVIVDPGAVFSGKVDGGNTIGATAVSTLELAFGGSTGTLAGLGSKYIDFAQVIVDSGASWLLSGGNTIVTGATLTDSGTLTNAGVLLDDGQLTGDGTLINDGGISVASAGGLALTGGAVTNAALGTIYGAYNGLAMRSGGSVVNAGTIIGAGFRGYGVYLGGGSLTNQHSGTIVGGYNGVVTSGGTVTNHGAIYGTGPISEGIQAADGGLIVNAADGTISAPNFIGVGVYNAPGTIINAGVISGYIGVFLYHGGMITNSFGGVISGSGGYIVKGLNGAVTVSNAGTIAATKAGSDAVILQSGFVNRVVIAPGAVFYGIVDGGNTIGAGVISTLELASAASTGTLAGLGSKYIDFGQVTVDSGASWLLSGDNTIGIGVTLTLDNASLTDSGTLVDNGTIQLDPSTLTVDDLTGTGVVTIGAGGTLTVEEMVSSGQTISFGGTSGLLAFDKPRGAAGTIGGFVAGDTIKLVGITQVTSTDLVNGDTLQVGLSTGAPIDLLMSGKFSGEFFHHTSAGGNTDITVDSTPCFCRGTLIRTDRGDVPVEALAIGDRVATASGKARPIRWIGRRHFDLARHPEPNRVRPIRILADAFADGAPNRDLFLSPDHAVLCDGVLVPARLLLNGASIRRDTACRRVTYYHVELAAHDILLAENLPVESYLDTGNRGMFENTDTALVLHPDLTNDQRRREAESCAPFADDEARIEPIWRALTARAVGLGLRLPAAPETSDDPALYVLVDGRRLAPSSVVEGRHVFMLPSVDSTVRLISRNAVRSETAPFVSDDRCLGVMLSELIWRSGALVVPVPLDHPALDEGWWQPEWHGSAALRRWTNGDAVVPLPGSALTGLGACLLEVEIVGTVPYPSGPASRQPAMHRAWPERVHPRRAVS